MVHDNTAHAAAICFHQMPRRETDQVIASAAFAPILQGIARVMLAFGMSKSEIKEQVLYNREGFDALVDYAFDRFVPEFAVETSEGIYRLIYDPLVKR